MTSDLLNNAESNAKVCFIIVGFPFLVWSASLDHVQKLSVLNILKSRRMK